MNKTKKTIISLIIMSLTVSQVALNISVTGHLSLDPEFEVGDYLIYNVEFIRIYLNGTTSYISFPTIENPNVRIVQHGTLKFEIIGVNESFTDIHTEFTFETDKKTSNDYTLVDSTTFSLAGNEIYIGDGLWGYFPFVYPENDDDYLTGIIDHPNTLVKQNLDHKETRAIDTQTSGRQKIIWTEIDATLTNDMTFPMIYGYYDTDNKLAHRIFTTNPWWSIFPKGFELRGSNTELIESNLDFGPPDIQSQLLLDIAMFISGPGILVILGGIIFISVFILKRKQRKNNQRSRNKSKKRRRRR